MSETLKLCPFCGGEVFVRIDVSLHPTQSRYRVGCDKNSNCHGWYGHSRHYATEAEAITAWNTRAADKPETFHDGFYDCECTVDAGEDTREKLEADLKTHLYEFGGYCFSSREGHTDNVDTFFDGFVSLLDRQAAITERECHEYEDALREQHHKRIAELKAERDELCRQVDEQPCINALRETTLDYTERLGEAAKTLHIETRCTYDDLRVLCKTLMGVFE